MIVLITLPSDLHENLFVKHSIIWYIETASVYHENTAYCYSMHTTVDIQPFCTVQDTWGRFNIIYNVLSWEPARLLYENKAI